MKNVIPGEAIDEALAGKTSHGTPVTPRTADCFPAEARDLFWQMDKVIDANGSLVPIDFDQNRDGVIDDKERDAIRGRNTWLQWGGGNETFWNWLQQYGYGLSDFLILMDSRQRGSRFKSAGLINQPGFQTNTEPFLGLYLDKAGKGALLLPPGAREPKETQSNEAGAPAYYYDMVVPETQDAQGRPHPPVTREAIPASHQVTQLFEPWITAQDFAVEVQNKKRDTSFQDYVPEIVRARLPKDGLDTNVYGYPSGIVGLRLVLNPDFFAKTADAEVARKYWKERVESTNGRYYSSTAIHADPKLTRPFKAAMSCGFCHIAPHPLNPPVDPEKPGWENLSSIIGNQYWDPQPAFGNLLLRPNFLHHFLRSQAPGTIDTSLVSSDQINNTNIINTIFDVPARLERARVKAPEEQSRENLLLKSIEDPGSTSNQRHFPMVLIPGEDSVGVWGALSRVPLNIGVFSEEWGRCDNPALGYTPQRPFRVEVCKANSVYWNVNEKYRVDYMAAFFNHGAGGKVVKATTPMKLQDAGPAEQGASPERTDKKPPTLGRLELDKNSDAQRGRGRKLFLENCAICHSSKQPPEFELAFERKAPTGGWSQTPVPAEPKRHLYTLPMEYGNWNAFKLSPSFQDYVAQIKALAGAAPAPGAEDAFLKDNFLSNELRIPVTLVGTYAGRALATNAMRGQVWDNFSSETFKHLPSVGNIQYYNPFLSPEQRSKTRMDTAYGTNAEFNDGRQFGGPGYYRPPTLISIWATAPYFHNNTLGAYTHDPSVQGRLTAFNDGIRKLLWPEQRPLYTRDGQAFAPHEGDLRWAKDASTVGDPGYIYRLPVETYADFQPGFIRPLIEGLLVGYLGQSGGHLVFMLLSFWWWVLLSIVFAVLIFRGRAHLAGILLLFVAGALAAVLLLSGLGGYGGTVMGALMLGTMNLLEYSGCTLWAIVIVIAVLGLILALTRKELRFLAGTIFLVLTVATLFVGILTNKFLNGRLRNVNPFRAVLPNSWSDADYKGVHIGPIPKGTPVNLIMNLDPDKRDKVPAALVALLQASAEIRHRNLIGDEAYKVFAEKAGPALMAASKCPDFVLDRGHYFGEVLVNTPEGQGNVEQNNAAKEALIAFLKTL